MAKNSIVNPHSTVVQSGKPGTGVRPRTFAAAVAVGFQIIEEHLHGSDLNPRGHFLLERIDTATGDAELITVPCSGRFTVGPVKSYRVARHAYMTPEEAKQFNARVAKAS